MRTLAPILGLLVGCTDAVLMTIEEPPPPIRDDRFAVSGRFCTDEPQPQEFPLRVLFVVDISQSMNVTDPAPPVCTPTACFSRRGEAVLEVLEAYPAGNGVEYGLMTFASGSSTLTQNADGEDGFTADTDSVKTKIPVLNSGGSQTNYEGALADAYQMLLADMARLGTTARSRARYVVIFISDGFPNPANASYNSPDRIRERVEDILALERSERLAEIKLHTVYLNGPSVPPAAQLAAKELLADMARVGTGTFRTFEAGQKISFFYLDFRAFVRSFELKRLVVSNENGRLGGDRTDVDSDGDGLLDLEELSPGSNPLRVDSDGDGWNDQLEVRLRSAGFDPMFAGDADCALDEDRLDDDGDGLRNCEERFLGTNSRLVDSDADGLPDNVEVRFGSNPSVADDLADADLDGADNGLEIAAHTDPRLDDTANFSANAYRYSIELVREEGTPSGRLCYDFDVENITLVPTEPAEDLAPGTNTILLQVASTPQDSPEDYGNHSVACVRPRYRAEPELKEPPSGRLVLNLDSFKLTAGDPADPEVFDATRDCVVP